MAESSWQPDRVIYIASTGRRITPALIEELLAERDRPAAARPAQRRAAARSAEREAIAARPAPQLAKGLVAGRGQAPPNPPPPAPSGRAARQTGASESALRREIAELEADVDELRLQLAGHLAVRRYLEGVYHLHPHPEAMLSAVGDVVARGWKVP